MTKDEFLQLRVGDVVQDYFRSNPLHVVQAVGDTRVFDLGYDDANGIRVYACRLPNQAAYLSIVSRAEPAPERPPSSPDAYKQTVAALLASCRVDPKIPPVTVPFAATDAQKIEWLSAELGKMKAGYCAKASAHRSAIDAMERIADERGAALEEVENLKVENRDLRIKLSLALGTVQVLEAVNPPDTSAGLLTVNDGITSKWGR
jgi:hypothetical protein